MRPLIILPAVVILAGCVSPSAVDDGADTPTATGSGATLWSDCEQWHLHFDARAEDLAAEAPPGYVVSADTAGLTQLLIHVTLCPGVEEAFIGFPVTAATTEDDPDRVELATIQVFHGGHAAGLYPQAFGARLIEAAFERAETATGPTLSVTGDRETFTVASILSPSSGTFSAERWVRIAHDGMTYGIVNVDGSTATNLGYGPVAYTHQGSGGAPPATAGIAHHVEGLDVTLTMEVRS